VTTCALLQPQEVISSNYLCTVTAARRTLLQLLVHCYYPKDSSSYLCTITTARRTLLQLPVYYYHRKKYSSPITCVLLLPQGLSSSYPCTITTARNTLLQLPMYYYCRKEDSPPIIQLSNRRPKQTASRLKDMCCRKHINSFEDSRLLECYRIDW